MNDYADLVKKNAKLLRVARVANLVDKRCLKWGILPGKKVCLDIESWHGENDLSCINCKLFKALADAGLDEELE